MAIQKENIHGQWGSSLIFVLAAAGAAVGLGNIWKFPFMAGENGGAAFVLVYLVCIFVVGLPLLLAEILLGRRGQASPINAMTNVATESKASKKWSIIGWLGALAGFLVTSYYVVIAGWAARYTFRSLENEWSGVDAATIAGEFSLFRGDGNALLIWGSLFLIVTMFFVARGVKSGLEAVVRYIMPVLIVILLGLLAYAFSTGYIGEAASFMFKFEPSKLTNEVLLSAVGHAFFTLSLGMGAIMAYGAYMPRNASIAKAAVGIVFVDTLVAILAGLVIFSVVFAHGLNPGSGTGLLFETLPVAFGAIPGGWIIASIFFLFVTFAALTSSVSLVEPFVAYLVEKGLTRIKAAIAVGVVCWLLSIGSALSYNVWSDVHFWKGTFIDNMFYITDNILLPLGGILIGIFVGWCMKDTKIRREMKPANEFLYLVWRIAVRWVAPIAVIYVMAKGFGLIDYIVGMFA